MKYIDAEKLIAEIKRRLKRYDPDYTSAGSELKGLLSFVASLQREQPDNEDIDKVAQELYEHLYELKRRNNVPTNLYDKQEIIDLWKAGIEYGRSHPKQAHFADASKMGPEVDLEKEIEMYISSKKLLDYAFLVPSIARHFYELGLNARKEE